ncbi:hypothetical protein C2845_PM10G14670 [Panicum miliaceum]|uniref:Uncharacterized protein n=1 Tax=Panicum miliaceum TaxID=4540 RepID=A0A3L6PED4_PANMI|nr:hypothetical protein C2845_PM10G14670 [Panicum miliaceum]
MQSSTTLTLIPPNLQHGSNPTAPGSQSSPTQQAKTETKRMNPIPTLNRMLV